MRGVISSIKHQGAGNHYCSVSIEGSKISAFEFSEKLNFEIGEVVESNGSAIHATGAIAPEHTLAENADRLVSATLKGTYHSENKKLDNAAERMWGKLSEAAALAMRKFVLCTPIVIRFHNDADGAGGACCLYLSLKDFAEKEGVEPALKNLVWLMHRGVSYGVEDAMSDVLIANNYTSIEKPLLILVDFGTAMESNAGIRAAEKKFDIIWLDHHPLQEGFNGASLKHYVNPWAFGMGSDYTAGFIACAFTRAFSNADVSEFEAASLIGDRSPLSVSLEKGRDTSAILDLLTSDVKIAHGRSDSNLTPSEMISILNDKSKSAELMRYVKVRLGEAIDEAVSNAKIHHVGAAQICVLDFGKLRKDDSSRYPLPGRFASIMLDEMQRTAGGDCVVVLHFGQYLSIRISRGIEGRIGILDIISEMRSKYGDGIDGGGGHANAASIKLMDEGIKKAVIKDVIELIRQRLSGIQ